LKFEAQFFNAGMTSVASHIVHQTFFEIQSSGGYGTVGST